MAEMKSATKANKATIKTQPKATKKPAAAKAAPKPAPAPEKTLVDKFLDELKERNNGILERDKSTATPPVISSILGLKIIELLEEIRDHVKK